MLLQILWYIHPINHYEIQLEKYSTKFVVEPIKQCLILIYIMGKVVSLSKINKNPQEKNQTLYFPIRNTVLTQKQDLLRLKQVLFGKR
jgi:hypothetical protein